MRGERGVRSEASDKLGCAGSDTQNRFIVIVVKITRGVYYRSHIDIGRIRIKRIGMASVPREGGDLRVVRQGQRGNTRDGCKYRAVKSHSDHRRAI